MLEHIIHVILGLLAVLATAVLGVLATIEGWLRASMSAAGIGGQLQTVVLVVVALLFIVGAFRLFGGLIRLALILILVLLLLHMLGATPHGRGITV